MNAQTYSHSIGGRKIEVTLTNWAEQASGSVLVRLGDTTVLATATLGVTRESGDFFPLTVEYEERFYAAGKILGSRFIKRESRPSEEATLAARMIDRAIRPRFDMRQRQEVQVVVTVLSIDEENDPDIPALIGSSLALSLSDIPWKGPIAGIRVGKTETGFVANPSYQEREAGNLDLALAGTGERINMIEAGAKEISEEEFASAAEWGFGFFAELIEFQNSIIREHGREKKTVALLDVPDEMKKLIRKEFASRIEEALYQKNKRVMREMTEAVREEWLRRAEEEFPEEFRKNSAEYLFDEETNEIVHRRILEKDERPDGRKTDEVRELSASVAVLPRVHGSGLFMRGETHVLSILTLDSPGQEQIVESIETRGKKHFLHHYNFPPYSTGETKPMRGPGRREIGHGALAWKALFPMIPSKQDFPYTIRIVSEILSSNGSTSMASVCGSTLALMDAGVPIKKPVAGAAMGLMLAQQPTINNQQSTYKILTDLQGPEDHYGDMDFKVAGTRDGITAVQLDVKIDGLTPPMVKDTLLQAHRARMQILDVMTSVISGPRPELSPWAPRVTVLKINPEKIGALIGPGGKVINEIIEITGAQIDIEDDGTVFITSDKEEGMAKALALVKQITRELKLGELLEGRVTRILDFGAFVEVGPRQEGLIHISELAPWHVEKVTDIVNIGDIVPVKIREIDEQGRINLSLKDVPGRYSEEEMQRGREERLRAPAPPRSSPRGRDTRRRRF